MRPRGGVVTQRTANPCSAGSNPARGLHSINKSEAGTASLFALLVWFGTRRLSAS